MGIVWNEKPKDESYAHLTLPQYGAEITPEAAKELAVCLAYRGIGQVSPNPLVGAVIVDSRHRFLAAGAHLQVGTNHAEVNAIEAYEGVFGRSGLHDATMYVTLEPCAHSGRTPACAPRVATCGFRKVVFGVTDPNPKVNGRGAAILAQAGIPSECDTAWAKDCERLAEFFLLSMRKRRPFVGLKAATSLDGMIARRGDRKAWITGTRARQYGHFLRVHYDAVMVGRLTVELDNPVLDARDALWPEHRRTPRRIVLDPGARVFKSMHLDQLNLLKNDPETVIWVTAPGAFAAPELKQVAQTLDSLGVKRLEVPLAQDGRYDPSAVLAALHALGMTSVLLEGGAGIYRSFFDANLVDRLHLFQAPRLYGAEDAIGFTAGTHALSGAQASDIEITPLGDDWMIEARL